MSDPLKINEFLIEQTSNDPDAHSNKEVMTAEAIQKKIIAGLAIEMLVTDKVAVINTRYISSAQYTLELPDPNGNSTRLDGSVVAIALGDKVVLDQMADLGAIVLGATGAEIFDTNVTGGSRRVIAEVFSDINNTMLEWRLVETSTGSTNGSLVTGSGIVVNPGDNIPLEGLTLLPVTTKLVGTTGDVIPASNVWNVYPFDISTNQIIPANAEAISIRIVVKQAAASFNSNVVTTNSNVLIGVTADGTEIGNGDYQLGKIAYNPTQPDGLGNVAEEESYTITLAAPVGNIVKVLLFPESNILTNNASVEVFLDTIHVKEIGRTLSTVTALNGALTHHVPNATGRMLIARSIEDANTFVTEGTTITVKEIPFNFNDALYGLTIPDNVAGIKLKFRQVVNKGNLTPSGTYQFLSTISTLTGNKKAQIASALDDRNNAVDETTLVHKAKWSHVVTNLSLDVDGTGDDTSAIVQHESTVDVLFDNTNDPQAVLTLMATSSGIYAPPPINNISIEWEVYVDGWIINTPTISSINGGLLIVLTASNISGNTWNFAGLSGAPAGFAISRNGQQLPPSDYSWFGSTLTVVNSTPIDLIQITYITETAVINGGGAPPPIALPPALAVDFYSAYEQTPGINQWASLETLLEPNLFINAISNGDQAEYGFLPGSGDTFGRVTVSRLQADNYDIDMNYNSFIGLGVDPVTFSIVVSPVAPVQMQDLLNWTEIATILPNDQNDTLLRNEILDASVLGALNPTGFFYIAVLPKQHFDGVHTSLWPNSLLTGENSWVAPILYDPIVIPINIPGLILHMNGSEGSMIITDSSVNAFTIGNAGSAVITEDESYLGGSSLDFIGDVPAIVPNNVAIQLGSGDYTIDFKYKPKAGSGDKIIFAYGYSSTPNVRSWTVFSNITTNILGFHQSVDGMTDDQNADRPYVWTIDAWHKCRIARIGNTIKLYVQGNQLGANGVAVDLFVTSNPLAIGNNDTANVGFGADAYIDEIAIVKGTPLDTGSSYPVRGSEIQSDGSYADMFTTAGLELLTTNLQHAWKLEDISDPRPDYGIAPINMIPNGTVGRGIGIDGHAANFSGAGLLFADDVAYNGQAFALSFWFKAPVANGGGTMFHLGSQSQSYEYPSITFDTAGDLVTKFAYDFGGISTTITAAVTPSANNQHLYTLIYGDTAATSYEIYVDNVLVDSGNVGVGPLNNVLRDRATIGATFNGPSTQNSFFTGLIGEVYLFNTVAFGGANLTKAQFVSAMFNSGASDSINTIGTLVPTVVSTTPNNLTVIGGALTLNGSDLSGVSLVELKFAAETVTCAIVTSDEISIDCTVPTGLQNPAQNYQVFIDGSNTGVTILINATVIIQPSLILHFNGGINNDVVYDSSNFNHAITGLSNSLTTNSDLGSRALQNDKIGYAAAHPSLDLNNDPFTIDIRFSRTNAANGSSNNNQRMFVKGIDNSNGMTSGLGYALTGNFFTNTLVFATSAGTITATGITAPITVFNRVRITRDAGGTGRLYLNGTLLATAAIGNIAPVAQNLSFGRGDFATESTCTLDELIVYPGVALTTGASYVVPVTEMIPDGTFATLNQEPPVLLLNMNGANGSTNIVDESVFNRTVTVVGDVQIDTSDPVFGTGEAIFDGTTGYLTTPAHPSYNWREGFSIEMDVTFNNNTVTSTLFAQHGVINTDRSIFIDYQGPTNQLRFRLSDDVGLESVLLVPFTPVNGLTYKLAFNRLGNVIKIYSDLVKLGELSIGGLIVSNSAFKITVGADEIVGVGANFLGGKIDNLVVTIDDLITTDIYIAPLVERVALGTIPFADGAIAAFTVGLSEVDVPGLNQWATIKPIAEAAVFIESPNPFANRVQYGYFNGPDLTTIGVNYFEMNSDNTLVKMDYQSHHILASDNLSYSILVSTTPPATVADMLTWDEVDYVTPVTGGIATGTINISADVLGVLNPGDKWYVGMMSKEHFDGLDPSMWADSNSNGASPWVQPTAFTFINAVTFDPLAVMHFDDALVGDIIDAQENTRVLTPVGGMITTTTSPAFGANQLEKVNQADNLVINSVSNDFNFRTGNLTIEFVVTFTTFNLVHNFIIDDAADNLWINYRPDAVDGLLQFSAFGQVYTKDDIGGDLLVNTPYRIACVVSGKQYRMYLEGNELGGTVSVGSKTDMNLSTIEMAHSVPANNGRFRLDELRISNIPRYFGASYTPAVAAFLPADPPIAGPFPVVAKYSQAIAFDDFWNFFVIDGFQSVLIPTTTVVTDSAAYASGGGNTSVDVLVVSGTDSGSALAIIDIVSTGPATIVNSNSVLWVVAGSITEPTSGLDLESFTELVQLPVPVGVTPTNVPVSLTGIPGFIPGTTKVFLALMLKDHLDNGTGGGNYPLAANADNSSIQVNSFLFL